MKKTTNWVVMLFVAFVFSSCTYHHHHAGGLPPGQEKKLNGSTSAKPYAPGQQKKR